MGSSTRRTPVVLVLLILLTVNIMLSKAKRIPEQVTLMDLIEGMGMLDKEDLSEVSCDEAIDNLILGVPNLGSLFYVILNGWYLGQWGDYEACNGDVTEG